MAKLPAERRAVPAVPGAVRAAAILSASLGIGFGTAMIISLARLADGRDLPMTPFGFRAFAGGPFDELSPTGFKAIGCVLVATSVADVLAGAWLWKGQRRGSRVVLATSPVSLILSVGFALPFLLVGVPLRAALIALGRRGLR